MRFKSSFSTRIKSDISFNRDFKYQGNMSFDCLFEFENMGSCPCYNATCVFCPCRKDRQDAQSSKLKIKKIYKQVK